MRLIGHRRVSTREQADSGLGLDAQTNTIDLWAAHQGHDIIWRDDCTDEGVSGAEYEGRPGLQTALRLLHQRDRVADGLVVARLDRASRSVVNFGTLLKDAKRYRWTFVAIDLGVDTSTPTGKLVANVMMAVAEWQREIIAQTTSEGLQAKKRQGHRLGRPVTLADPVRALIRRLRASGASYAQVADLLNDAGVPTAHGGKRWHGETVRGVVRSLELDQEAEDHRRREQEALLALIEDAQQEATA